MLCIIGGFVSRYVLWFIYYLYPWHLQTKIELIDHLVWVILVKMQVVLGSKFATSKKYTLTYILERLINQIQFIFKDSFS